jgi:hypothetical protein
MSEDFLRLIPRQPAHVPDENAVLIAEQLLKSYVVETSEVNWEITEYVEFIDAGANLERITCPACGKEISHQWWASAMDEAYRSHFSILEVLTPCCGRQTTLNDLNYEFPQGFARFVLQARYPGIASLAQQSIDELERILGCHLRVIWAHY